MPDIVFEKDSEIGKLGMALQDQHGAIMQEIRCVEEKIDKLSAKIGEILVKPDE